MKSKVTPRHEARARVFKALGHPTRLFIVETLANGEYCVCGLQKLIGSDLSTVSKHLAKLREAGIVDVERQGNQIFYSLRTPCLLNSLPCVDEALQANAEQYTRVLL